MGKRKTFRIKDIARESGASLTTVSLVLNRRDHRISEATRQRVLDAVERLGYRPSRLAQGLQAQRTGFIAVLVPKLQHVFADIYFGELISAIHEHAAAQGYKVLLEVAHPEYVRDQKYLELFDRDYVDGLLCLGVTSKDEYLRDFEDRSRAMLVVNNSIEDLNLNYVRCDYGDAGRQAGQYLAGLGHRRIGMIYGAREVQTSVDLQTGFAEALRKVGVDLPERRMADGLYTEEGGAAAAATILRNDPTVTAVLAGNDKMAIGALAGIKKLGLRVPHDVSVVGCDDIHMAAFSDPPLTTIHTPIYDLGKLACRRLLELFDGKVDSVEETYPVGLTVRQSAASPSAKAV